MEGFHQLSKQKALPLLHLISTCDSFGVGIRFCSLIVVFRSWLSHFVGGEWRRALVLSTTNMDDLLAAAGALGEAIQESTPEAGRVFTEVCPEHEDYIWEPDLLTGIS